MLKELLKNREFSKIIKKFLKKPEILDIILFGSIMRGKEKPRDIDLLIIYAQKIKEHTEITYQIRKELKNVNKDIEVISKRYDELFKPEFLARESILSEGFSIREKKFISESLGYKNFIFFKYFLKDMNKSKRMQFYYSLHGRGKEKGVLEKNKCYKFSDTIIICPMENSETIKSFLERWKIEYEEFPILIQEKIVKYKIARKG